MLYAHNKTAPSHWLHRITITRPPNDLSRLQLFIPNKYFTGLMSQLE